jgi:hypothetical protein
MAAARTSMRSAIASDEKRTSMVGGCAVIASLA